MVSSDSSPPRSSSCSSGKGAKLAFHVFRETEVQQRILEHFAKHQMVADHPPICAVGPHSGDPHYSPEPGSDGVLHADSVKQDVKDVAGIVKKRQQEAANGNRRNLFLCGPQVRDDELVPDTSARWEVLAP